MGPDFRFPRDGVTLWITAVMRPEDIEPGRFGMALVGRMRPGVTMPDLERELGPLAQRLPERFGGSPGYAELIRKHRPVVRPLEEQLVGRVAGPIWILFGSVAVVLLIACANVGNLFLVRAERRQRELAVRRAIGAARLQLFRAQITEAPSSPCSPARSPWCWPGSAFRCTCKVRAARRAPHRRRRRCAGARCSSPASPRRSRRSSAAGCRPCARPSRASIGCATAAAGPPRAGTGPATASWWRRRRSRSCSSPARRCCSGASRRCGTWIRATTPATSSPSRSRPRASTSTTPPRSPGSTSPSWSGSRTCRA